MRVVIAGPRDYFDYEVVKAAIESSNFEITEIVHGDAKGVDRLGQQWAEENGIPFQKFPAEWNNLTLPGAVPKTYASGNGVYNATAGFYRNQLMADYADALIAINLDTSGTGDMVKRMRDAGKPVYLYDPREQCDEEDIDYVF